MPSVTRLRHLRQSSWRRVLSPLLALGLGFSAVEVAWGAVWVGGDTDSIRLVTDRDAAPQTPGVPEGPLRHAGHDTDCSCVCAGPCAGGLGEIVPQVGLSGSPVEAVSHAISTPERLPASVASEPLLRPPLA